MISPVTNRSRLPLFSILAFGLFAIVPVTTLSSGESERLTAARIDDAEQRELRNQSAVAVILGEFRASFSDLIFIKTERYLHNGVAYMPHMDLNEMAKSGTIQSQKEASDGTKSDSGHDHTGHDHDHGEDLVSVIKPKDQDFRGFVGRLEREVKPWLPPGAPHRHTSGTELLPWYRLATLSNPHNERAYTIGAWWLKAMRSDQQLEEALRFMNEGVSNNPRSFSLYLMRGYLLRQLDRDEEALADFRKAAELAIAKRPPDGAISEQWTDHMDDEANAAMTMTILMIRDQKSPQHALNLVLQYEARMGTLSLPVGRIKSDLEKMTAEE